MRPKKKLSIPIFILGLLFALASCKFETKNKFHPRLPNVNNFNKEYKSDSCLFSISVKGDSILIADNDSSCFIKDFSLIDSFVCSGLKSGRIDPDKDYPIMLYIDSMTPYPVVDRLFEELQLIGIYKVYTKTNNKGFILSFLGKEDSVQKELVKLYGQRFERKKNIIMECSIRKNLNSREEPPPPPPNPIYMFYENNGDFYKDEGFYYGNVGIKDNKFLLGNKKVSIEEFCRMISKKKILFIKMNNENLYKDFIKMIDVICKVANIKQNYYSLSIFKKNFIELNEEEQKEIRSQYGIFFMIIDFASQNYINEHKKNSFHSRII